MTRKLVTDVETRWNSTLALICSLIENYEALQILWQEGLSTTDTSEVPHLSEQDWQHMEELAKYLIKFEFISNRVQGEHVLASEALIAVKKFKTLIETSASDGIIVETMEHTIRCHLQNHRAKLSRVLSHLKCDSLAIFCALVDPRAAWKRVLESASELAQAKIAFRSYAKQIVKQWQAQLERYENGKVSDACPRPQTQKQQQ